MRRIILRFLGFIYFTLTLILIVQWIIVPNLSENKPVYLWIMILPLSLNFFVVYSLIKFNLNKSLLISPLVLIINYFVLYNLFNLIPNPFNMPDFEPDPEIINLITLNISITTTIMYFFWIIIISLILLKFTTTKNQLALIKKYVLDMSTKATRLKLKEISEMTKIDKDSIKHVIRNMIKNDEVYAKYFSSSKSIVFDQETNIAEIQNLMNEFEKWEKNQ